MIQAPRTPQIGELWRIVRATELQCKGCGIYFGDKASKQRPLVRIISPVRVMDFAWHEACSRITPAHGEGVDVKIEMMGDPEDGEIHSAFLVQLSPEEAFP